MKRIERSGCFILFRAGIHLIPYSIEKGLEAGLGLALMRDKRERFTGFLSDSSGRVVEELRECGGRIRDRLGLGEG